MISKFSILIEHEHSIHQSENESFEEVVLLLHGFQLDGRFMFKRFSKRFGEEVKVVAPNAPFMVPLRKDNEWLPRYGWYFYDAGKKNFYINYDPAALWLSKLMKKINPEGKKTTIIGYSQGGYLAPKVAELIPEAKTVLGINSIFRSQRFKVRPDVAYHQVHGSLDDIVSPAEAREEFESMKANGEFITVEAGHPLNHELIESAMEVLLDEKGN